MVADGCRIGMAEEVLWLCMQLDAAEQRAYDALAAVPSLPGEPVIVVPEGAPIPNDRVAIFCSDCGSRFGVDPGCDRVTASFALCDHECRRP